MGCGYLSAVLAQLVSQLYSIELIPELFFAARRRLKELNYTNIHLKLGDGSAGWSKHDPFDAIIVSAVSPQIPQPFLEQLSPNGRLILPIGSDSQQTLHLVTKQKGHIYIQEIQNCRFVKLRGRYGHNE